MKQSHVWIKIFWTIFNILVDVMCPFMIFYDILRNIIFLICFSKKIKIGKRGKGELGEEREKRGKREIGEGRGSGRLLLPSLTFSQYVIY